MTDIHTDMYNILKSGKWNFLKETVSNLMLWHLDLRSHSTVQQLCDLGWFPSSPQSSVFLCGKSELPLHRVVIIKWNNVYYHNLRNTKTNSAWLVIKHSNFSFESMAYSIHKLHFTSPCLWHKFLPVQQFPEDTHEPWNFKEKIACFPLERN